MKSHDLRNKIIAGAVLGAFALAPLAFGEAKKPKYSIEEVMKAIHKGDDNIGKRVVKGLASKEDIAKMVEYYASLPLNDPPRGDKQDWMKRTAALVKASREVKSGAPGAIEDYKVAADCKACHEAHRPKKEKK